jgi:hypothetical protein
LKLQGRRHETVCCLNSQKKNERGTHVKTKTMANNTGVKNNSLLTMYNLRLMQGMGVI